MIPFEDFPTARVPEQGRGVSPWLTTDDPPSGLTVRVFRDADGIFVRDFTGIRYGWGQTLEEATAMWASCVQEAIDETNAGGPYLAEVKAYRAALLGESAA